ncbi:MAG: hypothetical protein ABIU30_18465 [Ferruginibacter sp.]
MANDTLKETLENLYPGQYPELWKFFYEEHDLMLLNQEIEDIISEVKKHLERAKG